MQEILNSLPAPMQPGISIVYIAAVFIVLILILNSMIFKPLIATMDERARRIKEGKDASANASATVEESQARYQAALMDARKTAQATRMEMLKSVGAESDDLQENARTEASDMVAKTRDAVDKEIAETRATLEQQSQELAEAIAAKVLAHAG